MFQTEVRLFFSPQLPLLLFPQEEPASNDYRDREHHGKDYHAGRDETDQLLRIHGHIFCRNKERQRPLGVFQDVYKRQGYPYVLVSPMQPEAGKTYQVAICGVSDQLAAEATVTDSGVVGLDAAKAFFGAYTTISRADTAWS